MENGENMCIVKTSLDIKTLSNLEIALLNFLGEEKLTKIQSYKIGIAGAGGLGSNCAMNLVRSGFREFKIVDFDKIEASNLNRQFYFDNQVGVPKVKALKKNLLDINKNVQIEAIELYIDNKNAKELFSDCDILVEAFDNADCKAMLVNNCYKKGRLMVAVSGIAGWGESDSIKIRRVNEDLILVGDFLSEVSEELPPISPRVNIAAAKQADIILNYCLNKG